MGLSKINLFLNSKKAFYFALLITFSIILYSFVRDWRLDNHRIPCDLRNRVVGSRLLFTDQSPYFYKWKNSDPVTLYDFAHYRKLEVSAVTASPFLLLLIKPISYFDYYTVSKLWLIFEFICIILILFLSLKFQSNYFHRCLSAIALSSFTLSNAWMCHVDLGQYYLFVGTLIFLIYFLLYKFSNKQNYIILAIVLSLVLVLIRPLSILVLFPIIFNFSKLKLYILGFGSILLLTIMIFGFNKYQNKLWQDYFYSINYYKNFHLGKISPLNKLPEIKEPEIVEGYNMQKVVFFNFNKAYKEYLINYYKFPGELGFKNFTMKETAIHYSILCFIVFICSMLLLKKITGYYKSIEIAFCLGIFFYIATEIFIPINRATYNQVQWLALISFIPFFKNTISIILTFLLLFMMSINITDFDSQIITSELFAFLIIVIHLATIYKWNKESTDNP